MGKPTKRKKSSKSVPCASCIALRKRLRLKQAEVRAAQKYSRDANDELLKQDEVIEKYKARIAELEALPLLSSGPPQSEAGVASGNP